MLVRILAGAHHGRVVHMEYETARRAIKSGTVEKIEEVEVRPAVDTTNLTPAASAAPPQTRNEQESPIETPTPKRSKRGKKG